MPRTVFACLTRQWPHGTFQSAPASKLEPKPCLAIEPQGRAPANYGKRFAGVPLRGRCRAQQLVVDAVPMRRTSSNRKVLLSSTTCATTRPRTQTAELAARVEANVLQAQHRAARMTASTRKHQRRPSSADPINSATTRGRGVIDREINRPRRSALAWDDKSDAPAPFGESQY